MFAPSRPVSQIVKNSLKLYSYPKMIVCDMAGTTVNEGGIVYDTIFNTVKKLDNSITRKDIIPWHGVKKTEVLTYFCNKYNGNLQELESTFTNILYESYNKNSIQYIHPDLPEYFHELRKQNIKIALNTSYSKPIQNHIISILGFADIVDDWICADDVKHGRPHPDMIKELMKRNNIKSPMHVCKVDDTPIGILEGRSAGCFNVAGVLSGAETEEILLHSGADGIENTIIDFDVKWWFKRKF